MATSKVKRGRRRQRDDEGSEGGGIIPKEMLSKEIASILRRRDLTQTEAARIMNDAPSQVSLVVTGKLRGFSTERLLRMLARLGRDVDIVIRPTEGRRRTGKVRVLRGN